MSGGAIEEREWSGGGHVAISTLCLAPVPWHICLSSTCCHLHPLPCAWSLAYLSFLFLSTRRGYFYIILWTAQQEGIRGLFRGLWMRLLVTVPGSAVTFASYEIVKRLSMRTGGSDGT